MFLISSFYHIADLDNYEDMKPLLLQFCVDNDIKGTIILSEEGINATVCGREHCIKAMFNFLSLDHRLSNIVYYETYADFLPFQRMKVVLKKEIVKLGVKNIYAKNSAQYIDPDDWDKFIEREDVKLIDTRNFYETQLGSFEGAIIPQTKNFRDFPEWFDCWVKENNINKEQNIAMFCTGGIRCEKSTALLKVMGFNNVYHLKGGIIAYLVKNQNKDVRKWFGDCFVFDDRVALTYRLQVSMSVRCRVCGSLAKTDDLKNTNKGTVICLNCVAQSNKVNLIASNYQKNHE